MLMLTLAYRSGGPGVEISFKAGIGFWLYGSEGQPNLNGSSLCGGRGLDYGPWGTNSHKQACHKRWLKEYRLASSEVDYNSQLKEYCWTSVVKLITTVS